MLKISTVNCRPNYMLAINFPQQIFKEALFHKVVEEYLVSLTNPMYMCVLIHYFK